MSVTQPNDADDTSLMYLCSTPLVAFSGGIFHASRLLLHSDKPQDSVSSSISHAEAATIHDAEPWHGDTSLQGAKSQNTVAKQQSDAVSTASLLHMA